MERKEGRIEENFATLDWLNVMRTRLEISSHNFFSFVYIMDRNKFTT